MLKDYAKILDIATYLPEGELGNDELATLYPDWPASKIYEKTGIKKRHIANIDQTAGDLALQAARTLFSKGKVAAEDVDFIILCSQAPDYILPTTACILQDKLGISKKSGAMDINLGCSGFVYGLSLAKGLIETSMAKCVLLLTADTYSKIIHPMDKSVRTLFGDGASATAIISSRENKEHIGPFVFGTDGSGAPNLMVEAGLFRRPKSRQTTVEVTDGFGNTRTAESLYMNGSEVMAFSLREVPLAVVSLLEKAGMKKDEIDFFVLHQANKFMLEALRRKLGLPQHKFPVFIENCGNTVSSSIPLALDDLKRRSFLQAGHKLMFVGFGVGYSWAGCIATI